MMNHNCLSLYFNHLSFLLVMMFLFTMWNIGIISLFALATSNKSTNKAAAAREDNDSSNDTSDGVGRSRWMY
jgi:hypothetical protein